MWQFVTLSSFADYYCGARSCYFNTYALQSNNRSFVQESVRGGICYANPKFVKTPITVGLGDFDMVSMYPSAQKRIGQEGGYPMGPAAKIPTHMLAIRPLPYFHYIIRIRITRITKYQQIPFVSLKIRGLVRRFNAGELPPEPLVVDKITLEDYDKYCGIEYEVIEGLCWDNEGITECKSTIVLLKELRDEYKRAGNPAQILIKLIMNMGYGKNVLKKADESHVIKELSESLQYISERFGLFKTMTEFGNHAEITMAKYDESFTRNHIGSMILSMSKRCFHEVLDLCNFLQINVYYVDTDSMHVDRDKIPMLATAYEQKFNAELIGSDLGQFHSDFDISCKHNAAAYSRYCLILGPKVYFDDLLCEICGNEEVHYRAKGIPSNCVENMCRILKKDIKQIYQQLCTEPVKFYLNPPERPRFMIKITGVYTLPVN